MGGAFFCVLATSPRIQWRLHRHHSMIHHWMSLSPPATPTCGFEIEAVNVASDLRRHHRGRRGELDLLPMVKPKSSILIGFFSQNQLIRVDIGGLSHCRFPKIGVPRTHIHVGFFIIHHPFWGSPIYGNPRMVFPNPRAGWT